MANPTYAELLEEARELGRLDGALAAALEVPVTGPPTAERCLGRTPAEFARLLWEGRPGDPPTGLEVNAPLWYATGFVAGLAVEPTRHCGAWTGHGPADPPRGQGRVVHRWADAAPAD